MSAEGERETVAAEFQYQLRNLEQLKASLAATDERIAVIREVIRGFGCRSVAEALEDLGLLGQTTRRVQARFAVVRRVLRRRVARAVVVRRARQARERERRVAAHRGCECGGDGDGDDDDDGAVVRVRELQGHTDT